ncbi:MAG: hypothetical protein ACQETR_02225, partial [Thermodesulfobacteriota bacterium]
SALGGSQRKSDRSRIKYNQQIFDKKAATASLYLRANIHHNAPEATLTRSGSVRFGAYKD